MKVPTFLFCWTMALLPTCVCAQGMVPATNEFRVNQNVPSDQYLPQIAVGPSNDYVVVWKSWQQDGSSGSVYFRRYNSAHVALTGETLVATGVGTQETQVVKVVYWEAGKYIIAWNDASNLRMRVLHPDNTMGATVDLAGNVLWDIAVRGNSLTVFYGSGSSHLFLRTYDLGTNAFVAPALQATESGSTSYEHPNVRYRSDGSLVAIYGRGNYPQRIYRKTFDADLLAQINETLVYEQNNSLNCIDVSINVHDEVLISTKWGVNGTDVYKAWVLGANGSAIVNNLGVFSCPYAYYTSECALFDNGDFVIVMSNRLSLNDPDDYNVRGFYAANYNAQNTGVVVMSTTVSERQVYPAVEKRSDGGFVVVWEGNGFQGDDHGINARAWSGASFPGVMTTSPLPIQVAETGTTATLQLRLGTQPTGNVVVDMSVNDATEALLNVAQVTFTPADWDQPHPVVVTGLDDVLDDGNIAFNVIATMNASTADGTYAAMGPKNFAGVNRDDDATLTMPADQAFCRLDGLGNVNMLVSNVGDPVGSPSAQSSDQQVVDNSDITVTQLNATTFSIAIADLEDNVPGTATITVSVTDGHFTFSNTFDVTTQGATPVITWSDMMLNSTSGTSYQWFLDGAFIPDAMGQTYAPTVNGNYTVLVVDANGCTNTSEPYFFGSTGAVSLAPDAVVIYPQPATDRFFVKGVATGTVYRLLDARGRVVAAGVTRYAPQAIEVTPLAPGLHVLLLDGEEGMVRLPVMVE